MMTLEMIAGALVLVLALAATAMLVLGIGGALGVIRFARCAQCARLNVTWDSSGTDVRCMHCQHERLLHPVSIFHRAHAGHH